MRCTLVACVSVPSTSARYLLTFESFWTGWLSDRQKNVWLAPAFRGILLMGVVWWFINVVLWRVDLGGRSCMYAINF